MRIKTIAFLVMSIVAATSQAAEIIDTATIVSVAPVTQPNPPRQVCNQQVQPAQNGINSGGVVGGIAGALIGSQIGKGNGRVAGAAVGAATGALVGNNLGNNANNNNVVCTMVSDGGYSITGYDIVYQYNRRRGHTYIPYNSANPNEYQPGQTIRVGISAIVE